jgi:hypothetical protein
MRTVAIYFTAFFCAFHVQLYPQNASQIFTGEELVYYGLDFSKAKLVGDFGNGGGFSMKEKMFKQWNELILKEQNKFDIGKTFRKGNVYFDVNPVAEVNSKVDETQIKTYNAPPPLSNTTIGEMVQAYPQGERSTGTAVTLIVEAFNKPEETAIVHVTFFDIASKKVLLTERMTGAPSGTSLRNYWANAIHEILIKIQENKYSQWKKQYKS